jgi:hypothetical protein
MKLTAMRYPPLENLKTIFQKFPSIQAVYLYGFCNVDLIILPGDDVVLQYEAVRLNRIVYQRPDFDSATVFSLFVRRFLDFLPYLKVQREAYKQRVLNGQA